MTDETIADSAVAQRYLCTWCGAASDGTGRSCPSCGAPIDATRVVDLAKRWERMPGVADGAGVQFGGSTCEVTGRVIPIAHVSLAEGDSVYFPHHVMLYRDPDLTVGPGRFSGVFDALKRAKAGLPLVMLEARGAGRIGFAERQSVGELFALPIQPGRTVDLPEHVLVFATGATEYEAVAIDLWFDADGNGIERPLGSYLDRFGAGGSPGLVLAHAAGNVFVRELAVRESILVKFRSLLFKDSDVSMKLHLEVCGLIPESHEMHPSFLWLRLEGPGRVGIRSAHEEIAHEITEATTIGASDHSKALWIREPGNGGHQS